jgi:MFS transporter, PPP family, 3-phenylpropionic acid transporter
VLLGHRTEGGNHSTQPYHLSLLVRFGVLYATLYAAFGALSPFLPRFLGDQGLSAQEIGTLVAIGTMVRLASGPIAGRLADRWGAWRSILALCATASGTTAVLYLPVHGFWHLLIVGLMQSAALAPLPPLSDAMAVTISRATGGFEYGWVRGAGSAAFIAGSLAAGWADTSFGLAAIIWLNACLLGLTAISALPLPALSNGPIQPSGEPDVSGLKILLAIPPFRRLLLVGAFVLGSHALHDTFAMIRWTEAGIGSITASVLWSESVAAEVIVFLLLGPPLLRRLGPARAAALAATAAALRWTVMAMTANVTGLALVEPLHGLSFALLHLAAMHLIGANVPLHLAATAQAVYGTLAIGVSAALLTFASGWLYALLAGASFWIMALLCVMAIPLTVGLTSHLPITCTQQ